LTISIYLLIWDITWKPLDLQGSIGLVQLTRFKEIDEKRKNSKSVIESILLKYVDNLKGVKT
jgi:CDP-6-deoxy-D-xylo-4-hexulose-3-dehydrase